MENTTVTKSFMDAHYEKYKEVISYIRSILDDNTEIEFHNGIIDGDEQEAGFYSLPTQSYINKYNQADFYKILKIFKDKEGYFAEALSDDDSGNLSYTFTLEELDTIIIFEIADLIPDFINK